MTVYVVDASVMLKWVLGEDREHDYEKAIGVLNAWVKGSIQLAAPSLWKYEVGNFLGRQLPEEATDKINLLLSLGIVNLEPTAGMFFHCFTWMRQIGVSFYDAVYLAAALEVKGLLITADRKFRQKMKASEHILLLEEITL